MTVDVYDGAATLAERIAADELSAAELTETCLQRIAALDDGLNAFSVVTADEARKEALARDEARSRGEALGPLHGVPVAVKEELDVAGLVTTFGGRANRSPAAADGEVVRRLRAAGAVVVGKVAMPEFGQWPFTESVAHGLTRNPWQPEHTPGGSSGGSAAAVAAGLVPVAIGGDGGGSIRIPSACCGLFGLKPQRGRVSAAPMSHLWWALGTVGPLTRSVRDSALVYDVVRGSVASDRFRAGEPAEPFVSAVQAPPRKLRIAWSTKPAARGVRVDPSHAASVVRTAELLRDLGHEVTEIDPRYPDVTAAFTPQFFGGVAAEAAAVEHPELLERRTRETLRLGAWVRPAVVEWAVRHGDRLGARLNRVFEGYDVLLTPMLAQRPPRVGVLDGAGTLRAAWASMPMIAYAAVWNVAGNPAASVPTGFADDGLPLAVQLVGPPDGEPTLLNLARQLEQARPWADRRPPGC